MFIPRRFLGRWTLSVAVFAIIGIATLSVWWTIESVWLTSQRTRMSAVCVQFGAVHAGSITQVHSPFDASYSSPLRVTRSMYYGRARGALWFDWSHARGNFNVSMPLWLPTVLTGFFAAGSWRRFFAQQRRQRLDARCDTCGYPAESLSPGAPCPECGTPRNETPGTADARLIP